LIDLEKEVEKYIASGTDKNRRKREIFAAVWLKQDAKCFYCDIRTSLPTDKSAFLDSRRFELATREHLIRKATGGSNKQDNIVMACARCNEARNEDSVQDHIIRMSTR
jgi:5-methylcytosine-specific restriction endonuclease McrA